MIRSTLLNFLAICPGPTHPPTHPPNHTPTHGWGILHRFHIYKQNEIILISSSVIEFLLILGVPPKGGGRWVDWGGIGFWGCGEMPHALCTCTHSCTHTHMHVKHDKHGCLHVGGHLQFLYMYTCVCIHVHMYGYTPYVPRHPHPSATSPEPQGAQNTKIQCLELIEIIRFCLKILYL